MGKSVSTATGIALAALLLVLCAGPGMAQPPEVTIWVEKAGNNTRNQCVNRDDCELRVVANRGLGVCKSAKTYDPGTGQKTFCSQTFDWKAQAKGNLLTTDHEIVIIRSPSSTPGSDTCLDRMKYTLSKASSWKVTAKVQQNVPECFAKSVWFYDAILYYKGVEIDREDPGVIIDN